MKQFDPEEIKKAITEKYNWGPSSDWTNFHFKELSKDIEKVTGKRLSEETLKRIFGKRKVNTESYQPQAFSQMVLNKFVAGFGNNSSGEQTSKTWTNRKSVYLLFAFIVVVALAFVFSNRFRKNEGYSFSCKNSIDYLPFTAMFEYDISEIKDSVFSDLGRNEERFLPPLNTMINAFYKNAGVYNIHFYTRSKMLDSLNVIVYSNDWQAGYFPNNKPEEFKSFFDQKFYRQPDYFYASPEKLEKEGVLLKESYWTTYRYFSPFNKSLDNLTLETRVLNNASTGSYLCYDIDIMLIGDSGHIDFKFTQPKCSRFARLTFSEKRMNGEFDDLDAMSVDLSDWLQIKMITGNNNFNLYLSNTLIFSETYQKPLGSLLGVAYSFFGTGKIDYLRLKDQHAHTFYENEFITKNQD